MSNKLRFVALARQIRHAIKRSRAKKLLRSPVPWHILPGSRHPSRFPHLTLMRNFLIGLFLGAALTAGVSVSAGLKGPQLKGGSGPLEYVVIEGDEVVCVNPWVNVPKKTIEC